MLLYLIGFVKERTKGIETLIEGILEGILERSKETIVFSFIDMSERLARKIILIFVDAYDQYNCIYSILVDMPSQQRNCLKLAFFVAQVHSR